MNSHRHPFSRGNLALANLVEIAQMVPGANLGEQFAGQPNVNHPVVRRVEVVREEGYARGEGAAVGVLRGAKVWGSERVTNEHRGTAEREGVLEVRRC